MERLFEYVGERPKRGDVSLAVLLSISLHLAALAWIAAQHATKPSDEGGDPVRYVQIMPQTASPQFTEAPGPATERQPRPDAPLSDANRKAMTPNPTGPEPTDRPGNAQGIFDGGPRGLPPSPPPAAMPPVRQPAPQTAAPEPAEQTDPQAIEQRAEGIQPFRDQQQGETATDAPDVNWQEALRNMQNSEQRPTSPRVGRFDAGGSIGGDLGTAETGPLSFESNWFEWGDYAAKMIARIRVHWYGNMPDLIRTGLKGSVTIRFTIQRDGSITDIQTLASSGVPPYDNAARRALEDASPLAALPDNFPLAYERVTARFLYNTAPPPRQR